MDLYGLVVVAHVSAVIFALSAHGVSMFAMFRIRRETDRGRIGAILDLSAGSIGVAGVGLLVAVILGITASLMQGQFSRFWPWASIVVLVIVAGTMTPLAAAPMTRVRHVARAPRARRSNRRDRRELRAPTRSSRRRSQPFDPSFRH